jgi:hypothetical protein
MKKKKREEDLTSVALGNEKRLTIERKGKQEGLTTGNLALS